ncbi:FKBP-type peptidyl-prolyl cis-trans isomerase [Buchnera aphidicola]|uniref:FKBP-type peptidyl-prolyl cis-trans isomerase n=1 Tax=Buchnera aphidicola TaxID=9 RepID=UPI003463F256
MFLFIVLYIPQSFSGSSSLSHTPLENNITINNFFKNDDEKLSYSLGVSLGDYINQSFEKQKQIGINIDKLKLLSGVQDFILNKLKLSNNDIAFHLQEIEKKIKNFTQIQIEKEAEKNMVQGQNYMKKFSAIKDVQKTSTGLLYLIEKQGSGIHLTNNTKVTVHYKAALVNGVEFYNSHIKNEPVSFLLKDVILGWQEGLKYVQKGGKIKLVVPPKLAYGIQGMNGIPRNSTIIFEIEVLNAVNPA